MGWWLTSRCAQHDWRYRLFREAKGIVSLDVDVMDPTLAPGTGTLEPGGLIFSELDDLLTGVADKGHLVGFDVVEVNPYRDPSGRTAQTAVRLMIDLLGAAFH